MQAPDHPASARYVYLDGVRGLACLMVALSHYVIAFHPALFNAQPAQSHFAGAVGLSHTGIIFLCNADLGVAIFFVLSGFVLAASLAPSLAPSLAAARPSWPALAVRRWVRLCLPVLATSLLIWLARHAGAFGSVGAAAALTKSGWLNEMYAPFYDRVPISWLVKNCLFTFFTGKTGVVEAENPVLWTMPIELLGSLGLFAFYCIAYRFAPALLRRAGVCFALALIAVLLTWKSAYYGFGCGIALFEIRRGLGVMPVRPRLDRRRPVLGAIALLAGVWLGGTPYAVQGGYLDFINAAARIGVPVGIDDLHHGGAVLLVAAVLLLSPLRRLLASGVCQYLGRISFMLYLVQIPVLCSAGVLVFLRAVGAFGYNAASLIALAGYLLVAIAVADLASRLIDRPAIRLSRLVTMYEDRLLQARRRAQKKRA